MIKTLTDALKGLKKEPPRNWQWVHAVTEKLRHLENAVDMLEDYKLKEITLHFDTGYEWEKIKLGFSDESSIRIVQTALANLAKLEMIELSKELKNYLKEDDDNESRNR